uniref:Uncharacterized protein n=1 Tax=Sus scrofa TaxID=9823 RepID=A0A8D1YUU8_PIG
MPGHISVIPQAVGTTGGAAQTRVFSQLGRRGIWGWDRKLAVGAWGLDFLVCPSLSQDHGHKEDILCVAQCPPFLLATSSYDGEIIIWNVISGHVCCKLNTPSTSDGAEDGEGPDRSVSCLTFLKTRAANLESAAASLITNGPQGSITFWRLFGRTCPIANFTPSKDRAQVSSMVVTAGDARAYVADQDGFVRVYDIEEYGLWGPELQPPKTLGGGSLLPLYLVSLELIEEEKLLLSSSLDHTVRLWSTDGEYIGTFGQSSPWNIFTPASWSRSGVPCEVLTNPQSLPAHPALERGVPATLTGETEQEKAVEGKAGAELKGCYLWPWNTRDSAPCLTHCQIRETNAENPACSTCSPLGNTF